MKDLRLEGGEIKKPRQLPVSLIWGGKLSEKKKKKRKKKEEVCV